MKYLLFTGIFLYALFRIYLIKKTITDNDTYSIILAVLPLIFWIIFFVNFQLIMVCALIILLVIIIYIVMPFFNSDFGYYNYGICMISIIAEFICFIAPSVLNSAGIGIGIGDSQSIYFLFIELYSF